MGKVEKILLNLTRCSEGCGTEPDLADKAKDTLKALLIEMVGPKLDIP